MSAMTIPSVQPIRRPSFRFSMLRGFELALQGAMVCCIAVLGGSTVLQLSAAQAEETRATADPALRPESLPEPVSFEQRALQLLHVPAPVTGVAVSPDGRLLAVAHGLHTDMGELAIWKLADHTQCCEVKRPYGIRAVAFSPDGKLIATGDFDSLFSRGEVFF